MMYMAEQLLKLPQSFLKQYEGKNPKWGFNGLGWVVEVRTYARKKEDGTLEQWHETVQRVTEGNFNIEAQRLKELGKWTQTKKEELLKEAQRFYHLMFNLVITPPGRGLWMSGTPYAEQVGDAENNCWGVVARPQPYGNSKIQPVIGSAQDLLPSFAAVFTFDQAMKGGGVGVNIQRKNVYQMPKVKRSVDVFFSANPSHKDYYEELKPMGVFPFQTFEDKGQRILRHSVKDSREGWAEALQLVIDSHYIDDYDTIVIDVTHVRPRGEDIKGFGGVASGPAPLVKMLKTVNDIINKRVNEHVEPVEWGDIIQNIGCCVVAGNVRRTALILVGDQEDKEFVESKNYSLEKNQVASQWRWASNNSVDISSESDRETLKQMAGNIYYNGEPGYVNLDLSRNYGRIIDGYQEMIDGLVEVFNPCGEITLPNASPCNLFELNLPKIHELIQSGKETEDLYAEAAWLGARYAYRITFRPYEWESTRDIVYKHRRLGVGITGFTDWVLMKFGRKAVLGFDKDDNPIYNPELVEALDRLYGYVKKANQLHAEELEANPSIKVTTVKPSGTLSILMGVSAGMHFHWSPYMVRRVRIAANSPLAPVLMDCGYKVEPAITGQDEKGRNVYDYTTYVVEFPIKAPTAQHPDFQSAGDVPLKEQAAIQALLAKYWSDNAVSATLTFKKAKMKPVYKDGLQVLDKFGNPVLEADRNAENAIVEEITDILDRYKGVIKSTSLLPHEVGTFPQMPLEEISKEEYERQVARIKHKPWELIDGAVMAEDDDSDVVGECQGGHCPVK
jgi:ribonucleoside-triphosphate reductase (thioredoxin)